MKSFCNQLFEAPSTECKDKIQQKQERRKKDYVSDNNLEIAEETRSDKAANVLAYDVVLAAMRNKEKTGKEKERHA